VSSGRSLPYSNALFDRMLPLETLPNGVLTNSSGGISDNFWAYAQEK